MIAVILDPRCTFMNRHFVTAHLLSWAKTLRFERGGSIQHTQT